ncbi:uncharacterized protein BXIN_2581 [Babesia sp. Xinjiang]|uniref:uncharacterized protein n=1 Tax=Babesia sp. Xinjiang TaxID=462227 RepID=UPI000A24B3DF|nr:uncharacterized protein BXIN_2581 [Babesia sp. Xinjiang]ORM41504.1 hypothetical protein BXIN_2581 [Babesia sp. Xinjiang]
MNPLKTLTYGHVTAKKTINRGVVESRHDWNVLYNYAKHLAKDKKELTRAKCVTLMFTLYELLVEQEALSDQRKPKYCFLWNHNNMTAITTDYRPDSTSCNVDPASLIRYLRYMSRLKPYYRLSRSTHVTGTTVGPLKCDAETANKVGYDKMFLNLLKEDYYDGHLYNCKISKSHIGPLRISSDILLAYPKAFTTPIYVELRGEPNDQISSIRDAGDEDDIIKLLDDCVCQLIELLLIYFSEYGSTTHRCMAPMFLAVILYGTKLQHSKKSAVDKAYRRLHQGLSNAVTSGNKGKYISFRSIAYLLNSCLYPADIKPLCDFAAQKILESTEHIPMEWLENICFASSKAHYKNDSFYESISKHVIEQAGCASPQVCLNLLWSFARVGKGDMVTDALERRLAEFTTEAFAGINPAFRKRAADALSQHVSETTSSIIAGR